MSMFARKRFVSMAIIRKPSISRAFWNRVSRKKASAFARRRFGNERRAATVWLGPRARTDRRHHDRDRVDDRLGYFHYFGGIGAIERRTRLAFARVGDCRFTHDHRRAVLFRTCDDDAARGRHLRFLSRSLRPGDGIFIRLGLVSGRSNRNDCRCRDRVCKISRCFCERDFAGQLSFPETTAVIGRWICGQSFYSTAGCDYDGRAVELDKYARTQAWHARAKYFYICKNGGAHRRC